MYVKANGPTNARLWLYRYLKYILEDVDNGVRKASRRTKEDRLTH